MNIRLALLLAWRSLCHHRTVALATVLGVAIGMTVVGAILIVDRNSVEPRSRARPPADLSRFSATTRDLPAKRILRVSIERAHSTPTASQLSDFPTQRGQAPSDLLEDSPAQRGEADYQAMRLAVRLASLMAFSVGAIIVFYTMRFSVASRSRELSLLLCLGEERRNVVLSLLFEAALLGLAGTTAGLLLALPAARLLIAAGISTTGGIPSPGFALPMAELGGMFLLSVIISLLGAAGPARTLYKLKIVEVLQPRFISPGIDERNLHIFGFGWLMPPLMAAAYLALRPFMQSWLNVVQFFILEVLFAAGFAVAVLWWMTPLLRGVIGLAEWTLRPWLPLQALIVGKRLQLTSRKLVFTVAGVTLVYSQLIALHDITRSLKYEIEKWSREALAPYVFLERNLRKNGDMDSPRKTAENRNLHLFRMSQKVPGEMPFRLVAAADVNPYLTAGGRPMLGPGRALASRTLAAHYALSPGDRLVIHAESEDHRFVISEISDDIGFFAEDGQYVDLRSYFVFSDGNPLFAGEMEQTLGDYAAVRKRHGGRVNAADLAALRPGYRPVTEGWTMSKGRLKEIDRDFLIFDFILVMTVLLAIIGVANGILIQVLAREREFSVLRTVGVSRAQTTSLLLVEGAVIGIVSALLAIVLGHIVGAISVSFLDRFTLFSYEFVFSPQASALVLLLAVATCCLAAVYPAVVANRISSAESLHYE